MSRATPRKSRHRQHPSISGGGGGNGPRTVAASDYESDAAHYLETRGMPAGPQIPPRSNTELNLGVLQRYLPSIRSIVSIAANAVVYIFTPATQNWDKSGVEGTLFVCEQEPLVVGNHALPRACLFVLNRKGLDNVIVDLAKVTDSELASELLIFKLEDASGGGSVDGEPPGNLKVLGLWIHADEADTQRINADIIQELWQRIRTTLDMAISTAAIEGPDDPHDPARGDSMGPAMQAMGRRVSLSDLFGRAAGAGTGNGA